ncbi:MULTISPECIES: AfsR/SARP family transcriptional regulator [Actinomadura]|uniref:BTAD domain-containing putative transcriptional regulator n=1 Tax=Actinomadura yumaensis TaxID=111807 RepID=A0ABW2CYD7_9ACTN|nr:BTAD domain-containing putative transcriptional regulator [Actinomadura sp. J1-007]
MRIGILGPLDLRDATGRPVEVSGRRLRALLIRLAVDAGRSVSAERLLDDLWDGAPPGGNALQALVSRLRAVAGRDLVTFGPGGYRLAIDPGDVDAVAFERHVAEAHALEEPARRAAGLCDALALWRGPALADVADADFAAASIARLEELRIAATEDRVDADLAAGGPLPETAELEALAAAHPLRERIRGQLMRTLYASGRQAEALQVYDETRRILADRLGVDPSPELAAVHLAILRRDPDLDAIASGTPREPSGAPSVSPAASRTDDASGAPANGTLPPLRTHPAPTPRSPVSTKGSPSAPDGASGTTSGTAPSTWPNGLSDNRSSRNAPSTAHGAALSPPAATIAPWTERQPRTNLPAQLTSFVGREEESERVSELLRETRLVTLTGPGGAGKTRLAGEITARLVNEQPDGVWFVPLAPVSDPGDIAQAVLAALGVTETTLRPDGTRPAVAPLDRLTDFLVAKRLILVLDNCEHLIDAVAGIADQILGLAPGVRILTTSREPLGITGESLCPVPSLPLPPEDADAAARLRREPISHRKAHERPDSTEPVWHGDGEDALSYASVRLFADRAAAVRPGFTVNSETAPYIIAICRALDGIPLAIELAAARLRSLTVAQVADRLGDRFRLLTGGSRAALPRHRTLRAVVDWSWELLDDVERVVLRRLSVFAGGATPESAAAVCGIEGPGAPDPHDVLDVVAVLIDKSLVEASGDPEVRYRLLETVRVYAAERLAEAGEAERVRAAHARFFLALAERAEPELRRGDQLVWADRLAAERDNCNAAFRYVLDTGDVEVGLRMIAALAWFWLIRDQEIEAGGWAQAVAEIAADAPPPGLEEEYAVCVFSAQFVGQMLSEPGPTPELMRETVDRCLALVRDEPRHPILVMAPIAGRLIAGDIDGMKKALTTVEKHPDPWVRAVVRLIRGFLAVNEGQIELAAVESSAAYEAFQALGDRWGMMAGLSGLMDIALKRGKASEAVRLGEEALQYALQGVNPEQCAVMRIHLAEARAAIGDIEGARRDVADGTADAERIGEYADAAGGLMLMSELARDEGDLAGARPPLEKALAYVEPRRHRADFSRAAAIVYSKLGCLAEQEGDLEEAARMHSEAMSGLAGSLLVGNQNLAAVVEGLAALACARGDHERAAELLGTAHNLHGYSDIRSFDVRRVTRAVTEVLGEERFAAAYERGKAITHEEALALTP